MTDFGEIALYYDRMTGFKKRLVKDFSRIKNLVNRYGATSVLDAGCGTGVHSIILSKLGVNVVGLDSSKEMLEVARRNALNEGVRINLECLDYASMPEEWEEKFDLIICLANSIAGVESSQGLAGAFQAFHRVLKPKGKAVIQALNIDHFRQTKNRIVKISKDENVTFVRFLDFNTTSVQLNLLIIEHEMGQISHKFISEKILPVSREAIDVGARVSKFGGVDYYSDLTLADDLSGIKKDLVAVLTK